MNQATATAIETTTEPTAEESLDGLLTALGPSCALVMSFDADGHADWANCTALPTGTEAEKDDDVAAVSHERLAS